jgi:hypothetical protein
MVEPQSQDLVSLLSELSKVTNFEQIFRNPVFWKSLYRLKNEELLNNFRKSWCEFYNCKNCNIRLRRFPNGDFYCLNCKQISPGVQIKPADEWKFECLKCFRLLNYNHFSQGCYHICGFCISKELVKGKNFCKFCLNDLRNVNPASCNTCGGTFIHQNLFELRCGHIFCSQCVQKVKTEKRCSICQGTNLLVSEQYDINTRGLELCIICETNKPIDNFPSQPCCNLDICVQCIKSSQNCPGCYQNKQ